MIVGRIRAEVSVIQVEMVVIGRASANRHKAAFRICVAAYDPEVVIPVQSGQLRGPVEQIGLYGLSICQGVSGKLDLEPIVLDLHFRITTLAIERSLIWGRRGAGPEYGERRQSAC